MLGKLFLGFLLVSVLLWEVRGQKNGPPKITGSYIASGEMVETMENLGSMQLQLAFEESYDNENQMAAFTVWESGFNQTFVENFKTSQTFRYNGIDCTLQTVKDWLETKSPPSLEAYEDTNGTVRFSLKQLFALDDRYLKEFEVKDTFRGIPANKWMYEIKGSDPETKKQHILSIYAYWSDGTWSTSNSKKVAPLGYIVTRMNITAGKPNVKIHEQFINIFSFVEEAVDRKMFEPIQGVVCEGRKQTLEFPNVNKFQALRLHSEVILPAELEIRYMDMFLDAKNKMIRIDSERVLDEEPLFEEKMLKFQKEIVIGPWGVVFRESNNKGVWSCDVIPIADFQFDIQNLLNFKLTVAEWMEGKIFGRNETTYVYIGKTYKRDIPCHMFQGLRTDWPEPSAKVKSLWEWCFAENMTRDDVITFRNGDYGLIQAQVKVLESGNQFFYPGLQMIHHFYEVSQKDPDLMQATNFDVSKCFGESDRRDMQFIVDWLVTEFNIHLIENATSDVKFLQRWKNGIYRNSGLEPYSLRVTKLSATIGDTKNGKKLFVKFSILGAHASLPTPIRNIQKSNFDAIQSIRDNINKGKMFISYQPSAKSAMMKLLPEPHTLDNQIKGDFKPHSPPTESTESTQKMTKTTPFELRTETDRPIDLTSHSTPHRPIDPTHHTTHSTHRPIDPTHHTTHSTPHRPIDPTHHTTIGTSIATNITEPSGHGAGVVATVSVAMLLIGITAGSAGVFVYYNGMPKCSK